MDFQLKTLSIAQSATEKADVLIVLGKPIHTLEPAREVGEEYEPLVGRETPA